MPFPRSQVVLLLVCLAFLLSTMAINGQPIRQFDLCDSTAYTLDESTEIIAEKYSLYRKSQAALDLIYTFEMPFDSYYIRDFDIVAPDLWYTLVGDRTIGNETFLYQSTDQGENWQIDTSYYNALNTIPNDLNFDPFAPSYIKSINQVQRLGSDTILIFLGYYISGIVYSIDGGDNWTHWFANFPAHYHGLFECEEAYYLYQIEGDGFSGRMFPFEKDYLFRNDSLVNFDHLPSGSGHHTPFHLLNEPGVAYYASLSFCEVYDYLVDFVVENCELSVSTNEITLSAPFQTYPNPADSQVYLALDKSIHTSKATLQLFNSTGQLILIRTISTELAETPVSIDIQNLPNGSYYLVFKAGESIHTQTFVITR